MSPLARTLGGSLSLVEAMQTKLSIADLIDELREQISFGQSDAIFATTLGWFGSRTNIQDQRLTRRIG